VCSFKWKPHRNEVGFAASVKDADCVRPTEFIPAVSSYGEDGASMLFDLANGALVCGMQLSGTEVAGARSLEFLDGIGQGNSLLLHSLHDS